MIQIPADIAEEMAKFYRMIAQVQRYDDFEVAVRVGAEVGLDEAARSGDVVAFAGDAWSAKPRVEVIAARS